jgi:hypothetical protein
MTTRTSIWPGFAALGVAAVILLTLRPRQRITPPRRPIAWTPSYRMLAAADAAGVTRN